MRFLITLALIVAAAEDPMLSVYPRAVMVGGAVRITCRVPRHPQNRSMTYGFRNWTVSSRQLDGEDSPITWWMTLGHIPCEPGELFCSVLRANGVERVVTAPFTVMGCER